MIFLSLSIIFFVLSIVIELFYTIKFLENEFGETLGVPSQKVPVMFILDVVKAIHLCSINRRAVPMMIKAQASSIVLSFLFVLAYAAQHDGLI